MRAVSLIAFPLLVMIFLSAMNFDPSARAQSGCLGNNLWCWGSFNVWDSALVYAVISVAIIAGVAAGINILGSGLNPAGTNIVFKMLVFLSLWAIVSLLAKPQIDQFPTPYGAITWTVLTLVYLIGAASNAGRGE